MQPGPLCLRQWPSRRAAPEPAMLQPTLGGTPAGAAAHHEHAHRRFRVDPVLDAAHAAVEPAEPQREKILGEIAIDRGGGTELDRAGVGKRSVPMRPGPQDQLYRAALAPGQAEIVLDCGAGV